MANFAQETISARAAIVWTDTAATVRVTEPVRAATLPVLRESVPTTRREQTHPMNAVNAMSVTEVVDVSMPVAELIRRVTVPSLTRPPAVSLVPATAPDNAASGALRQFVMMRHVPEVLCTERTTATEQVSVLILVCRVAVRTIAVPVRPVVPPVATIPIVVMATSVQVTPVLRRKLTARAAALATIVSLASALTVSAVTPPVMETARPATMPVQLETVHTTAS